MLKSIWVFVQHACKRICMYEILGYRSIVSMWNYRVDMEFFDRDGGCASVHGTEQWSALHKRCHTFLWMRGFCVAKIPSSVWWCLMLWANLSEVSVFRVHSFKFVLSRVSSFEFALLSLLVLFSFMDIRPIFSARCWIRIYWFYSQELMRKQLLQWWDTAQSNKD